MSNRIFNTVGGSTYPLEQLKTAIKKGALHGDFEPLMGLNNVFGLVESNEQTSNIPPFILPVEIDGKYYVDLRTQKRYLVPKDYGFDLPAEGQVGIMRSLILSTILWDVNPRTLVTTGKYPIIAFGEWIAQRMSSRHGLNPESVLNLKILSCYWAICQRLNAAGDRSDSTLSQGEINAAVNTMISKLQGNRERYIDIIRRVGFITTINDFVKACREVEPVAFGNLEVGQLIAAVKGSWFGGIDSDRLCVIALEYQPMFLTFLALGESSMYKKTPFTTITNNMSSGRMSADVRQFKMTYVDAVKSLF
tara:strand:- start:199664 stop:200581 length:918 start_codon:yes stop_codon:yes gene_type:complete